METSFTCAIPGCQQHADRTPDGADGFCDQHFAMAPQAHRQRFLTVVRRLRALRDIWNNEESYDSVVASGRYLKLAMRHAAPRRLSTWLRAVDARHTRSPIERRIRASRLPPDGLSRRRPNH